MKTLILPIVEEHKIRIQAEADTRILPSTFSSAEGVLKAGRIWRSEGNLINRFALAPVLVPVAAIFASTIDLLVHSTALALKSALLPLKYTFTLITKRFDSAAILPGVSFLTITLHAWKAIGSAVTLAASPAAFYDPNIPLNIIKKGGWDQERIEERLGLKSVELTENEEEKAVEEGEKSFFEKFKENKNKVFLVATLALNGVAIGLKVYYEYIKWKNDGQIGKDTNGDGTPDEVSTPVKIYEFLKSSGMGSIFGVGYLF